MYGIMLVEVQGPLLIFPKGDPLPISPIGEVADYLS